MQTMNKAEDASPADWKRGDVILGLYEVRGALGRGGMGTVYRVRHRGWDTDLAVKCPHPEVLEHSHGVEMFERECETWVNLGLHPHIVSCYYVRRLGGIPRVFAEYVTGGTLHDWINKGRLFQGNAAEVLPRILDMVIQIAWGLDHAHKRGLVHQDIKPANVLLTPDGTAKVTDFGLARAMEAMSSEWRSGPLGTPVYFSPEHTTRQGISVATDVWSFGLLILEMFVGEVTWMSGQTAAETLDGYLQLGPERNTIPPMPAPLADLLKQCFQNAPGDRPQSMDSMAAVAEDLFVRHTGTPYPRPRPEAQSTTADQLNNQAVSLLDLGKKPEAERMWRDALAADPTHLEAAYNQALYQWRKGALNDLALLRQLKTLHESHPKSWLPHFMLAQVQLERGDCESAASVLKKLHKRAIRGHELKQAIDTTKAHLGLSRKLVKSFGNPATVKAIKLSWDGAIALTGGGPPDGPGEVHLWNVTDGARIQAYEGHTGQVRCVDLSADGMQAASGGKDGLVRLWPVAPIGDEHVLRGHTKPVIAVVFTEDGRKLASGSVDGTIRFWDRQTGRTLQTIKAHAGGVTALSMGEYNRTLVSAGVDESIRAWDLESGHCVREYRLEHGLPRCVAVSGDRRFLAAGTATGHLEMWEHQTGKRIGSRRLYSTAITALCLSKKGGNAVTGTSDASMRLLETKTGRCLHSFAGIAPISLSGDENTALSTGSDKTLCLWRIGFDLPELAAPMIICRAAPE